MMGENEYEIILNDTLEFTEEYILSTDKTVIYKVTMKIVSWVVPRI